MTTTIDTVLDAIDGAPTAGLALDAIPDGWRVFLTGPDTDGFASSLLPPNTGGAPMRVYRRGLAMGRGATRLEAIREASAWLRERMPQHARATEIAA